MNKTSIALEVVASTAIVALVALFFFAVRDAAQIATPAAYTVGQRCTILGQPVEIMEVHRDSDGPHYRVITAHMQTPMVRETTLEDCR